MIYLGIDPGQRGGISAVNSKNEVVFAVPLTRENLVNHLKSIKKYAGDEGVIACVEKVGAMPGQGVTSMFNFGKGAGFIEGVLEANGIAYQLVPPATWKKSFSLLHKDKNDSIRVCKQLFPGINLLPTERCKKESDGIAESLILAEFARRRNW